MTRSIPPQLLTALTQSECSPYYAFEAEFDSGTVRLWTGIGDRTINGETFIGAGHLLSISGLEEASDLSAKGASVTLSGLQAGIMSIALTEPYQSRRARIFLGDSNIGATTAPSYAEAGITPNLIADFSSEFYDAIADATVFNDVYVIEVFSGIMDKMPISQSPESVTVQLTVESKMVGLQRANVRRMTSANHQLRHPGDTFFDWTTKLADMEVAWGRTVS